MLVGNILLLVEEFWTNKSSLYHQALSINKKTRMGKHSCFDARICKEWDVYGVIVYMRT